MTMLDNFRINAASMQPPGGPLNSALLDVISNEHAAALVEYATLRRYWNGEHAVRLTDRLKQFLVANKFTVNGDSSSFSDNYCGVIVAALVDRLLLQSFTVPGEEPGPPSAEGGPNTPGAAAVLAQQWWEVNKGDALQKRVHEHAAALGDAYVIVEWDTAHGRPRFLFNAPELIRMHYDAADYERVVYATKRWTVTAPVGTETFGMVRLNVYHPDRIEKYHANARGGAAGSWERHMDADDSVWPKPWVDAEGEPLGVPVVHYRNDDRGGDYGRSELRDAIPLQDALNKALVDGIKIEDSQGWGQRWGTGVDTAPDGDVAAQPGSILWATSGEARFGQFEAADPEKTIAWMVALVNEMAHVTATPAHMFSRTGTLPSGESLKTAEAPLVSKARDRTVVYGNPWESAMELAVRLHNANVAVGAAGVVGPAIDLPDTGFEVVWESVESRPSEIERINAINAKQGISTRQRLREYGYSEEEIERIMNEGVDELTQAADIQGKAFDAGGGAGFGG